MQLFEKRALAYYTYRVLRKLASCKCGKTTLNEARDLPDNGTTSPASTSKKPAPKSPGMQMSSLVNMTPKRQKGYSGSFSKKTSGGKCGKCGKSGCR